MRASRTGFIVLCAGVAVIEIIFLIASIASSHWLYVVIVVAVGALLAAGLAYLYRNRNARTLQNDVRTSRENFIALCAGVAIIETVFLIASIASGHWLYVVVVVVVGALLAAGLGYLGKNRNSRNFYGRRR